ncbi:MAG: hypothetical protein NTW14_08120 [bacterium]|nr:hypothetical protein [bacterium]
MSVLITMLAYVATLFVCHFLVRAAMLKFRPPESGGVRGAGAIIGILERALVLTFVLINQYTAIGLVLTAKTIARYKELDDRQFAEYYLVGTLTSVLCAILTGLAAKYFITLCQ